MRKPGHFAKIQWKTPDHEKRTSAFIHPNIFSEGKLFLFEQHWWTFCWGVFNHLFGGWAFWGQWCQIHSSEGKSFPDWPALVNMLLWRLRKISSSLLLLGYEQWWWWSYEQFGDHNFEKRIQEVIDLLVDNIFILFIIDNSFHPCWSDSEK